MGTAFSLPRRALCTSRDLGCTNLTDRTARPGQGGRVEDLGGFLEEFAEVLVDRPRMLLQLALNMPNHTGVFKVGHPAGSRSVMSASDVD
eukprot:431137-Rhodomonas_salina.4